jgi:hypothetical protein
MGRTVRVQCCGICEAPIKTDDTRGRARAAGRVEGIVVEIGFSRGGWGHRDLYCKNSVAVKFSDEVCGDCFDKAQALLRPVAEFLRGDHAGSGDPVQPVRCDELEPDRRGGGVLRAVPFIRR